MKKIVCLLFFLSLFLFILPQPIHANHVPECGSACGGTCKPNEEFCSFGTDITFCMSNPKNPNCAAAPTPTPLQGCKRVGENCEATPCCEGQGLFCNNKDQCQFLTSAPTPTSPPSVSTPKPTVPAGTPTTPTPTTTVVPTPALTPGITSIPTLTTNPVCIDMKCEKDGETCPSPCGNFICVNKFFGSGKCVDKATFCPQRTTCDIRNGDVDCRDGSVECSTQICFAPNSTTGVCIVPSKLTPSPSPTNVPRLPPCLDWGIWDKDKNEYTHRDNIKDFQKPDGTFKDDVNVNCIKFDTAIGEINPSPKTFVARIFSLVLGLSAGISLILIILSGYKFMTSGANQESYEAARSMLVSAIVGLLFIIFSFVLLQIIGFDILRIPDFG